MKVYNCGHCGIECKWTHQGHNKFCGVVCAQKFRSLERQKKFFEGTLEKVDRATARKYLAAKRGYNCEECGISDWQGKKLTLHVDHKDGNPGDSRPENLRLLCPNCHSQTPFLGNANKGRGRAAQGLPLR
jgi:5-methylcytosine-specific restriction endonuclease McrA